MLLILAAAASDYNKGITCPRFFWDTLVSIEHISDILTLMRLNNYTSGLTLEKISQSITRNSFTVGCPVPEDLSVPED